MQATTLNDAVSKTEALNALGYDYKARRGVWTAERPGAVLITIWQRTVRWGRDNVGSFLYVDLCELLEDGFSRIAELPSISRHQTRAAHLRKSWLEGAKLDIVMMLGPIDNSSGKSTVWIDAENDGFSWRVSHVADDSGNYRLEARKNWN